MENNAGWLKGREIYKKLLQERCDLDQMCHFILGFALDQSVLQHHPAKVKPINLPKGINRKSELSTALQICVPPRLPAALWPSLYIVLTGQGET